MDCVVNVYFGLHVAKWLKDFLQFSYKLMLDDVPFKITFLCKAKVTFWTYMYLRTLLGLLYEALWSIFWCRFNRPFCLYLRSQRLHFEGLVSLWILACSCIRNSDMHEYSQSPQVNFLLSYKWFFSFFLCLSSWYLSGKVCWQCLHGNGCSLKCHLLVWIMTSLLRQLGTE